jgi:hypothetical protein
MLLNTGVEISTRKSFQKVAFLAWEICVTEYLISTGKARKAWRRDIRSRIAIPMAYRPAWR